MPRTYWSVRPQSKPKECRVVPKCSVGSLFYFFFASAYVRNSAIFFPVAEN